MNGTQARHTTHVRSRREGGGEREGIRTKRQIVYCTKDNTHGGREGEGAEGDKKKGRVSNRSDRGETITQPPKKRSSNNRREKGKRIK